MYVLRRFARSRGFIPVEEALRQVQSSRFFVDADKPTPPADGVVTIDLSLRNLLAPTVVEKVVRRLTDERFYTGLDDADPILANRAALMHSQVAERLGKLLKIVASRIRHVTMRQLIGFIAFLLSAGQPAAERLRSGQDEVGLAYSTLAFEGGDGSLFEAIRQIFDPAALTHPTWDERLWCGETDPAQWLFDAPAPVLTLPSKREKGFRAAKRRFFFEHCAGDQLFHLVPRDEIEFEELLDEGASGDTSVVRDLVLAINQFYEPDFPERQRDRLLLWQSHRYDVRAPAAFVSLRDLSLQQLRIEAQRYADWVERWLPPEQRGRRSFALVAKTDANDVAQMEIDRELFLTMLESRRGLGRSSWSRTATRRITRFIDQVDRSIPATLNGVEDIRIRNISTGLDEQFSIQRHSKKFQI